jgi:hypothetical protein
VQEHSADGVETMLPLDDRDLADGLGVVSREAEFGRVVQDQGRAGGAGEAGLGGREMPRQYEALVDPPVVEGAVSGLGGGPILAGHRHGGTDPSAQVTEELCKTRLQPIVGIFTPIQFAFDPIVHDVSPEKRRRGSKSALGDEFSLESKLGQLVGN